MSDEITRIPEPSKGAKQSALRQALLSVALLCVLLALGSTRILWIRSSLADALKESTAAQQKVYVVYTHPAPAGVAGHSTLQLPGTLIGERETAIYARATGYVRSWHRDIGARVKAGEVLAEIETPELDRQIEQARANQGQSSVNLQLAKQTLSRWQELKKDELVTEQELSEKRAQYDQLLAALTGSQAEVSRLESLKAFQKVDAPFAGLITKRNVELGKLVSGTPSSPDQALFQIAVIDRLKLVVYVPQIYSAQVKVGQPVDIVATEHPSEHFKGSIARTAGAIDSATRTLQVEVEIPNKEGKLLPGSYVQATLPLENAKVLVVPANSLLFRSEGPRLALITKDQQVHLAPITLGRDLGKTIEIIAGLDPEDQVILNPPDALSEGDRVDARPAPNKDSGTAKPSH